MPNPDGWNDINALPVSAEVIQCPCCGFGDKLEFLPMLGGMVWGQCPCGYGWELVGWLPGHSQAVN